MTEVFYAAVKGSLHANDCSVFGLKPEEISALGRRFSDSTKPVINGVLIKGTPLDVINSLAELGYRVTCSSGETEIVWTLRREALLSDRPQHQEKVASPVSSPQATPPLQVSGRPFVVQPSMLRNPVKQVERIGTKPEDWALVEEMREQDRIVPKHISSLEKVEPGQKIILKTNLSSEFNPLSKRPGPIGCLDGSDRSFIVPRQRSHSAPPATRHSRRRRSFARHPSRQYLNAWNSRVSDDSTYWGHRSRDSNGQYCYHVKQMVPPGIERGSRMKSIQRQGLQIYLEDIIAPSLSERYSKSMVLKSASRELFKHVFLPLEKKSEGDSSRVHSAQHEPSRKEVTLSGDAVRLCAGNCSCHEMAPRASRNSVTDSQQQSFVASTSDMSISIGSKHRPIEQSGNNVTPTASYPLEGDSHFSHRSDCTHKLDSGQTRSRADIYTRSEPCQRLHSCISNPHDDTQSDNAYRTTNSVNVPGTVNNELSINNNTMDKSFRRYSVGNERNQCPSRDLLSAESSYPDLTMSELPHSRGTSMMKSDSSTRTCPHGHILSELPYEERTFYIVNQRSDISQNVSRHKINGSPCPSNCHSVSERTLESYLSHSNPRRFPRCSLTCNDASSLCSSVKQNKKGSYLDDTELPKMVMEKIGQPKYEELEESDWSLISSLVDDICRNKRKKRRRAVPPYQT